VRNYADLKGKADEKTLKPETGFLQPLSDGRIDILTVILAVSEYV
jgi:hypothetical protein